VGSRLAHQRAKSGLFHRWFAPIDELNESRIEVRADDVVTFRRQKCCERAAKLAKSNDSKSHLALSSAM
jgi:hypothetical protein